MSDQRRVLVLFGHPAFQKSRVNRAMAAAIQNCDRVTFHDIYETYPDGIIHVSAEKALVEEHDVILLQHPFFWYGVPSLFKEWIDLVLQYGWAYGPTGNKLRGKYWVHAFSAGGSARSYTSDGNNRFTIRQLLAPLEQTAFLCGMKFLEPFVIYSSLDIKMDHELKSQVQRYRDFVETLRDRPDTLPS